MVLENSVESKDPRNSFTRDCINVGFRRSGCRKYIESLNEESGLGPLQSRMNLGIARVFDIVKYGPYLAMGVLAGKVAHHYLTK